MSQSISTRVAELGLTLEPAAAPAANYVSFVREGNVVHISGQIARRGDTVPYTGQLGAEVTETDGIEAARLCALGVIAQIAAVTEDRLDRVARVMKLGVFVASAPGFSKQSVVANGASDLLVEVFGEAGRHARSAVGVAMLPAASAVEVDATIALHPF